MKKLKKFLEVLVSITMLGAVFAGCEKNENSSSSSVQKMTEDSAVLSTASEAVPLAVTENTSEYFKELDLQTNFKDADANIVFNGSSAEISGEGVAFENSILSVTKGGTFVINGTLNDGQIYINTEDNVHVVLNGVSITNSVSSAIYVENAKNTVITLADNTENILTDAKTYTYTNEEENEPDAVIFSKDDLSFNGNGSLVINGNYNEGITTKNDLRIAGGKYNITSVGNGIKGKDSVVIKQAEITVNAGEDGIKSTNADEEDKGFIVFESGIYNITAGNDAVKSENALTVNDGEFTIKCGEGAAEITSSETKFEMPQMPDGEVPQMPDGEVPQMPDGERPELPDGEEGFDQSEFMHEHNNMNGMNKGGMMEGNSNKPEESCKGFKSSGTITVNGGKINADCSDDAVHADGDIVINAGEMTLKSGDDGIHSGANININEGNIKIENSYEGIEGIVINVNGGNIDVTSGDDGFNASDGTGSGMMNSSDACQVNINDGYVHVNAGGDGLDSNGIMNINGGTVMIDGPENDGNTALDSGSEIIVNGGTLIAAGSSGMLETPSEKSKQNVIISAWADAKTNSDTICLKDADGKVILSYTPSKNYSSVIISTPDIINGKEYSIYAGENSSESETAEKFTVSEIITQTGDGEIGRMGGGRMQDGMGDRGRMTPPDFDGTDKTKPLESDGTEI